MPNGGEHGRHAARDHDGQPLRVHQGRRDEDQKGFVASNVFSLAEAKADAERLYAGFGFERTGEIEDGKIVVRMKLTA